MKPWLAALLGVAGGGIAVYGLSRALGYTAIRVAKDGSEWRAAVDWLRKKGIRASEDSGDIRGFWTILVPRIQVEAAKQILDTSESLPMKTMAGLMTPMGRLL